MIIVEGGDNVGKSTLIKQLLALDPSLRLLHRERFKPHRGEVIAQSYLKSLIPDDGDRVRHAHSLADRFFASECIYGKLFRGGCRMRPSEHLAIQYVLRSYGTIVVHCDPGDDAIKATWAKRDQLYDSPLLLANAYREEMPQIFDTFSVIKYDWTSSVAEATRLLIMHRHESVMRSRERFLTWWGAMPYGVGSPSAPIMIVGESYDATPFQSGLGAEMLARCVIAAEVELNAPIRRLLYLTTTCKNTKYNLPALREEISFLQPKLILTMGRQAAAMVSSIDPRGIDVVQMAHPVEERPTYIADFIEAVRPFTQTLL